MADDASAMRAQLVNLRASIARQEARRAAAKPTASLAQKLWEMGTEKKLSDEVRGATSPLDGRAK
jgi:hypothetical protein